MINDELSRMVVQFRVPDEVTGATAKYRPVLLLWDSTRVVLFPITTKYKNKSPQIKRQYVKIDHWQKCGLKRESWVDTGNPVQITFSQLNELHSARIGALVPSDLHKIIMHLYHANI